LSGRREPEGRTLEAELRGLGAEAGFVRADVRHEKDVSDLVDATVARFGRLDVAVNNAGTEGSPGPVTGVSAETYTAMFDTNVLGTLLGLKHELHVMQAQGSGSIVNISSTFGSVEVRISHFTQVASTRLKVSRSPPRSRRPLTAFASMPWRQGQLKQRCLIVSPERLRKRRLSTWPFP
jgi:NAD(P)-dependent dehydrogenase (short-subunit alcohol dehydrogenase family)